MNSYNKSSSPSHSSFNAPTGTSAHSKDFCITLAKTLHDARRNKSEIEPLTKQFPEQIQKDNLTQAYEIQNLGIQLRQTAGEKIIGYKMGLTSQAKMKQMGLDQPVYGVLTNQMQVDDKGSYSLKNQIHPKAEPEIYFITKKDLSGKINREQAFASIEKVGVALEILDSRFKGFQYFQIFDVIADNSSSSQFVLGPTVSASTRLNLGELKISISENGRVVHEDYGKAILGDPLLSLCELVSMLSQNGQSLPSGSIVLAGAATVAIPLTVGQKISAQLENIGEVFFQVVE